MKIEDKLPYLGVEQKDGSLKIGKVIHLIDISWGRPDYNKFKSQKFQTETFCAEILIGINDIDLLYILIKDKKLEAETIRSFNDKEDTVEFNVPITAEDKNFTNCRIIELIDLLTCLYKVREMIDNGIIGEKLKKNDHSLSSENHFVEYFNKKFLFRPYFYYNPLEFLEWAKENSFPIPDELQFRRNAAGELEWCEDESLTGTSKPANQPPLDSLTEDSLESFVRSLTISFENDAEVNIQLPGKSKIPVTAQTIGFKNSKGITWKEFLKALQTSSNYYRLNKSQRDSSKKRLDQISNKLSKYLSRKYDKTLPQGFKMYERVMEAESSVYRFKFKNNFSDTFNDNDSMLEKFSMVAKEYQKNPNDNDLLCQAKLLGKKCVKNKIIDIEIFSKLLEIDCDK